MRHPSPLFHCPVAVQEHDLRGATSQCNAERRLSCAPAKPVHARCVRVCCTLAVQEHDLRATTLHCKANRRLSSHFTWTSHFTTHTLHFISSELFLPHLICLLSSFFIPCLFTCHLCFFIFFDYSSIFCYYQTGRQHSPDLPKAPNRNSIHVQAAYPHVTTNMFT